jgi:protein TonB
MERPSHIIFDHHQPFTRRMTFVVLAIGLQLGGFWLFTHGLASHVSTIIHDFQFVSTPEKNKPALLPPPEPPMQPVQTPSVPVPEFGTAPPENSTGITASTEQPPSNGTDTGRKPAGADRAATGVLSTHTVPPYPPIARRIGAEGTVTLRLTVSAEGRVIQAEVVTSSGQGDLDQTARQWILAHWTYKPALENGVPVASHVLAAVTFSLSSLR